MFTTTHARTPFFLSTAKESSTSYTLRTLSICGYGLQISTFRCRNYTIYSGSFYETKCRTGRPYDFTFAKCNEACILIAPLFSHSYLLSFLLKSSISGFYFDFFLCYYTQRTQLLTWVNGSSGFCWHSCIKGDLKYVS